MADALDHPRVFLTAEWRDLVMLNYQIEPASLGEYVPRGTELDSFGGRTLVSLVGFQFLRTKLFGVLPLPFHTRFEEVNLRFYVRRRDGNGEARRGVVFIREIVPKRAVAWLARYAYGENYSRYPMRHRVSANGARKTAEYEWRVRDRWLRLHAEAAGEPVHPADGSIEQFISEHYWGYSALPGSTISQVPLAENSGALSFRRPGSPSDLLGSPNRGPGSPSLQRDGGTVEYQVAHPQWRVWRSENAEFSGDGAALYGDAFGEVLRRAPDSAFIAEGSPVVVFRGRRVA